MDNDTIKPKSCPPQNTSAVPYIHVCQWFWLATSKVRWKAWGRGFNCTTTCNYASVRMRSERLFSSYGVICSPQRCCIVALPRLPRRQIYSQWICFLKLGSIQQLQLLTVNKSTPNPEYSPRLSIMHLQHLASCDSAHAVHRVIAALAAVLMQALTTYDAFCAYSWVCVLWN